MSIYYRVEIANPKNHMVQVNMEVHLTDPVKKLSFFLPTWSPGSYLIREYSRMVRSVRAQTESGEDLHVFKVQKNIWEVDIQGSELKGKCKKIFFMYEVYCHELTVRTSQINEQHAFLHGPSYLMGSMDFEVINPKIELKFPPTWSKVSTGLEDISPVREKFIYTAANYDELVDSPIEIGCQETDGFLVDGIEHSIAFFGTSLNHKNNLKKDIQTIVEHIAKTMGGVPYKRYAFITHLARNLYGGLEHSNSTALQFDGSKFADRESYINWLSLVAHEYFHTWNVKRIRPLELGPFNYHQEAMTSMLWLAEGLTSFMDDNFVLRAGLCSLEEYLNLQKKNLNTYLETPGHRFDSLEESSFDAWIKLYRPHENSRNSSVSYYLKGGLVFFVLNQQLVEKGKSIDHFLQGLWNRYLENPAKGVTAQEVFQLIEQLAGTEVMENFIGMVQRTENINFESCYQKMGLTFEWEHSEEPYLGLTPKYADSRVLVDQVVLDGPAHKCGLNAGDEILAIDGIRLLKDMFVELNKILIRDQNYKFLVARDGMIAEVCVTPGRAARKLREIKIVDKVKALNYLGVKA